MFFRMIFGLPGAAAITALLFLAMAWMIRQEATPQAPTEPPDVTILAKLKPSNATKIDPPPKQKVDAPEPVDLDYSARQENPRGALLVDPVVGPTTDDGPIIDFTGTQPTIRIPPAYPENCRARGAQGVVMVEFDVTAEGAVVNPRVIASENSCLDRAAMNTISKWKYTPKTDGSGRPVPQRGLRQTFNFQLTE